MNKLIRGMQKEAKQKTGEKLPQKTSQIRTYKSVERKSEGSSS